MKTEKRTPPAATDGAESALVAPLSSRRPGRPKWGPRAARRVLTRTQTRADPVRAIMDLGGTLLIGSSYNTRYILPPDWPYHAYTDASGDGIAQICARDGTVSELLLHTISVADAAAALGKSANAIVKALRHGALGGLRVRGIWRVSKRSVEDAQRKGGEKARPETSESRDPGSAGKIA